MPKNIANCEASVSNLRHMAHPRRRGNHFPGYLTAQQASLLGLAIRRGAPKTPIQVARFLGYNVPAREPGAHKPPAEWCRRVEAAVVAWLPALGLELHEEIGRTSDSPNAGIERYVDFRVPTPKQRDTATGPKLVVYRDPSLATWTKQEADRKAAERKQKRAAFWGHDARGGAA